MINIQDQYGAMIIVKMLLCFTFSMFFLLPDRLPAHCWSDALFHYLLWPVVISDTEHLVTISEGRI